jgi:condensin complex subunit 2
MQRECDDNEENREEQIRKYEGNEENTLEKKESNILIDHYDIEFDIDPLFKKTTAQFDESSAKGLLLNNLMVINPFNLLKLQGRW